MRFGRGSERASFPRQYESLCLHIVLTEYYAMNGIIINAINVGGSERVREREETL
jgi:hypothetical protein